MNRFDQRVKTHAKVCNTCRYCKDMRLMDSSQTCWMLNPRWVSFCMLDVPEEDLKYIDEELRDKVVTPPEECDQYTDRFKEIMLSEDFYSLEESCRLVYADSECCQFYEEEEDA